MKKIFDIYRHWGEQSWKTKIIASIPVLVLVFGWMFYDQYSEGKDMHQQMLSMCEADTACIAAVNQYADECFKDNYHMGRRRHGVRMDDFVACVNDKSGEQFFTVAKKR